MRKIRIPTYHISTIFDLNAKTLFERGFRLILTDLDNTLENYKVKKPSKRVIDKVKEFKEAGLEIIIISNNYKHRVSPYADEAGIEMKYLMLKPFAFKINKLIKEKGYQKSEVIMIGDQFYTDIEAGNRAHVATLLVDPLTSLDQPFTRIKRKLEKPLLKKLKKRNLLKEWEE